MSAKNILELTVPGPITHLQLIAEDTHLLIGTSDQILIYDLEGRLLERFAEASLKITASPDGRWIAIKYQPKEVRPTYRSRIKLYDGVQHTWREYGTFLVNGMTVSNDSRRFALVGYLEDFSLYDPEDGFWYTFRLSGDTFEEEFKKNRNCREMHSIAFLPDGSGLVTGGKGRSCIVWNWEGEARERYVHQMSMRVAAPSFSPIIVSGNALGRLDIWDRITGKMRQNLSIAPTGFRPPSIKDQILCCHARAYDHRLLIGGSNIQGTSIFDGITLERLQYYPDHRYFDLGRQRPILALGNQGGKVEILSSP